jgi:foldase protein PrsA
MFNVNRAAVAGLALAGLCVSLTACSGGASETGGDIATVNGQKISRADFDRKLEAGPSGKSTLAQLIQSSLVEQYAVTNKIDVTDAEIAKREDQIKARYPAPGQFEGILKQQGLTENDVHQILRDQVIIEKAVAPKVSVSEADIKAYFDKNHALLDTPEQVQARHILVADEKTADDIEAKLKAGGDFAALAKQYSTDPSTKDKGGELGFFGKGQMVPAFQAAAFADHVGKITVPVKSPFGWHIIQVEAKKPAVVATLANAHDKIRDQLKQQAQGQQVPTFLQSLRTNAQITITDDRLKDALPPAAPTAATPAPAK